MQIFIDNKPYEITSGKNLLETCLSLGLDIPYFCWHPAMGSVGACRQCAIKLYKDENDKKGRLVMSCMEPVANNQHISIIDPEAKEFRETVIEWLMTNHPHDCAVCDEGGSCHLQDMTVMTGHNYRRFRYKKRTHKNQYLGPFINHEMNRCIQCYRCVRFYKDYAGGKDLDVFASRSNVYFGRAEDGVLESEFSGNLAEVCPTGVFTDKTLKQHYTRKWDLTMAPSICQHCSIGCNTIAGERYGSLRMIANRYHGEVNGYFLCDRGRFGYEFVNAKDRIRKPILRGETVDRQAILSEVPAIVKSSHVIGIGSPRASLQANFTLKALVGEQNFYHGVSDNEHDLAELAIRILKDGPVRTPSTREVEEADAIFILGEDITNTAPILALAVRQAVRQQPSESALQVHIPLWNDAAVRGIVQDKKGPLYIASLHTTKLDELAAATYRATPDDTARLGMAVAHILDSASPAVNNLPEDIAVLAEQIARALAAAKKPVIISGAGCQSDVLMKASANIAAALHKKNTNTGLVFTMLECNSLGLAMMGGHRLQAAFNAVLNGHADTVIVLENDLYRHGHESDIDKFFDACKHVIVIDHSMHATMARAEVIIPAGTFAESDGILVNNEGRAQRFFQVYEATDVIQESWRWLLNIGCHAGNMHMNAWKNFEDVTNAIATEEILLKGVETISPPSQYREAGQRIPREPHRYSGRTSMNADKNVSEPKPPEDPDSAMSYTMEGYRGMPPSSMIPFFWSPGWNSVQSVNKYQQEIGASLRGGDPGIRLLNPVMEKPFEYFKAIPEAFRPMEDHLWIMPVYHIFGSEELSARSPSVAQRIEEPYILLHHDDALNLHLQDGELLTLHIGAHIYTLPVRITTEIPNGVAAVPYGFDGIPYAELPEWATTRTSNATYIPAPKPRHVKT
ncbi:MAG TPA: NADH-quinone oxidoreductase subunit NuoG [Ohtaekwangia sp.]|uniref:NADH-quinone oxidoreductase subunit NuoG n=1 Tax=Ohtaekwangia sp. TaxID=2066019 RepID=UPI002F943A41